MHAHTHTRRFVHKKTQIQNHQMSHSKVIIRVIDHTNYNSCIGSFCIFKETGSILNLNDIEDDELKRFLVRVYTLERLEDDLIKVTEDEIQKTEQKFDAITNKRCIWYCGTPESKSENDIQILYNVYLVMEKYEYLTVQVATGYITDEDNQEDGAQ